MNHAWRNATMKWILLLLLSSVGIVGLPNVTGYFGLTSRSLVLPFHLQSYQYPYHTQHHQMSAITARAMNLELCESLKLSPEQQRLCTKDRGMGQVLLEALQKAVFVCRNLTQHDRWNCSLGQYRIIMLNKGFRETAFLYALTSASLLHTVAKGCSSGALERCTCDQRHYSREELRQAWMLGSCGDNLHYALKFSKKFINASKRQRDVRAVVDRHNTMAGLRVVRKSLREQCKCHGVSGSCTTRTCWMALQPFPEVAWQLKNKYKTAKQVTISVNSVHITRKPKLVLRRKGRGRQRDKSKPNEKHNREPKTGDLVFLEQSPNFCEKSIYSQGTEGRVCERNNCHILCCGRGFDTRFVEYRYRCHCTVKWCCQVECDTCVENRDQFTCK